jgi:hypothetical protein
MIIIEYINATKNDDYCHFIDCPWYIFAAWQQTKIFNLLVETGKNVVILRKSMTTLYQPDRASGQPPMPDRQHLFSRRQAPMAMAATASRSSGNHGSIAIIGALFFVFGFVTWLNGPLISFSRLAFDVSETAAFLIPFAFYISYFCLALPSAAILKKTGMKKGMAVGLFVMAMGAVVFGQFTTQRIYPGAVTGIFMIGAGLAILQTAANPYISIVGPIESAAQRIAVMGICNKVAGILAPIVLGTFVLRGMGDLAAQVQGADAAT